MVTLPKLRDVGLALNCPAVVVPLPERPMVSVGFEAFEVTVTLPLAVPVVVGANLTVKVVLCPAVNVKEELIPLNVKPAPLMETFDTETLVPPLFVMVPERDWFDPRVTFPKPSDVGVALSNPGVAAPVPDKEIVSVGFEPSEVTVTLPVALPAEVGAYFTLKLVLCPAAKVTEEVAPTRLNPLPLIEICEIVTLAAPELVTVSDSD